MPHLLGCNCSFRKSALIEIGGFDEEYEYFLDETDVIFRIVDAGYLVAQLPNAFVHHMVRKIIATLVAVGSKKLPVQIIKQLLTEKNREQVPGQAPGKGLFLKTIGYDEMYKVPKAVHSQLLGDIDV